mgnify:CR=1 FL=1
MYSDKKNISILTSLLVAHGIQKAVVCPGSRNAPIVHNFSEHPLTKCFPVTDERSAGFFAIGLALATHQVVAVCVTSGSALLNLAPAVAEAHEQHIGMVVISADRPQQWIEQLDGQTITQPNVFGTMVNSSVNLPENIADEEEHWYCNRLINEALLATRSPLDGPVHINVPLAEPLFNFNVESLPEERVIRRHPATSDCSQVVRWLFEAKRPMVVMGQCAPKMPRSLWRKVIQLIDKTGVLLAERLSDLPQTIHVDEAMAIVADREEYVPDLIIYIGGVLVSKRMRHFLRKTHAQRVVMLSRDTIIHDVTMHLTDVVQANVEDFFSEVARMGDDHEGTDAVNPMPIPGKEQQEYHRKWASVFQFVENCAMSYLPAFSQMAAVKYFEEQLADMDYDFHVHYANSSSIRLANIYAGQHVYCNRGVNGIEGSLSTAAGFSAATDDMVFCIIGDLSFFYDQNALWNSNLKGNLRVILLNNGGGGIFSTLKGLELDETSKCLVAGGHHTRAQGICLQNDIGYLKAHDMEEMRIGIVTLLTKDTSRPMLLEIFTEAETDAKVMNDYYQTMNTYLLWQKENGK